MSRTSRTPTTRSLLHTFLATFRISRLTQGGGVLVSPDGGNHSSYTIAIPEGARTPAPTRSRRSAPTTTASRWPIPACSNSVEEFGDHIQLQILSVFPGFILQQIHNCLAVRHVVPRGLGQDGSGVDLFRLRRRSARDEPAAAEAAEPGRDRPASSRWRTAASAASCSAAPPRPPTRSRWSRWAAHGAESQATRATEASVRGFWKAYRRHMGY